MEEDQKLELGKALLASINAHRENPNARTNAIAAAVTQGYAEKSDVEARFFTDLDAMRGSDPAAFERVSAPMKVAYAEWKRGQA